jgi:hypothetical protein
MKKIFTQIKRIFKRLYIRMLILNRRYSERNGKVSQTEKLICMISRKLINHPESKFLLAPLSGKRYIKNTELGIFVILYKYSISITNHVYHYDVILNERNWLKLTKMYDTKVEGIREEYENDIMTQIKHSLENLNSKI